MKFTFSALGSAVVLGLAASQQTDTFVLSQCECPEAEFSAVEENFFSSPFKLARNAEDILQCFGDDDFPVAPGFTAIFTNEEDSTGFSATASGDFFFEGDSRSEWYVAMRLVLKPSDGALITLLDMKSGNENVLTMELSSDTEPNEESKWKIKITSEIPVVNISTSSSFAAETLPFDIIVGEGTLSDEFGVFVHVLEGSSTTFVAELADFIPLQVEDALSVEMFSGSTTGEPFAVQVDGFQFGRGKFPGFPDSGKVDPNDVLEALGFAPVAALPSVSQSELQRGVPGFQDASVGVDVTRFLVGGDFAQQDLEITIQTGELTGAVVSRPPSLIYTPPDDFLGNETFSFSYGISQPYACSNQNIPVVISIVKDSSASYDGDAGTALLAFFIAALLVAGMIVSARIYSRRQPANDGTRYALDDEEANSKKELIQGDVKEVTV